MQVLWITTAACMTAHTTTFETKMLILLSLCVEQGWSKQEHWRAHSWLKTCLHFKSLPKKYDLYANVGLCSYKLCTETFLKQTHKVPTGKNIYIGTDLINWFSGLLLCYKCHNSLANVRLVCVELILWVLKALQGSEFFTVAMLLLNKYWFKISQW